MYLILSSYVYSAMNMFAALKIVSRIRDTKDRVHIPKFIGTILESSRMLQIDLVFCFFLFLFSFSNCLRGISSNGQLNQLLKYKYLIIKEYFGHKNDDQRVVNF